MDMRGVLKCSATLYVEPEVTPGAWAAEQWGHKFVSYKRKVKITESGTCDILVTKLLNILWPRDSFGSLGLISGHH